MTARDLRTLLARADPRSDAELLAAADLTALVQRHGPLVWCTCRRMLPDPADAADAFQAVFLALSKSFRRIRTPAAVGGWLHAAAVRVCLKQRRTLARRRLREKRVARPEAVVPVADAAWDRILAAVHEEVLHLSDGERTAFVLCELQGVPAGEAATRLGWKPGTLTGRLSKARQRLLTRLNARGLAPAVGLATAGTLAVPGEVLAQLDGPASAAVVALSSEVTAMVTIKHLAAAVLVATGVLAGVGGGLVGRLDAQPPAPTVPAGGAPAPGPGPAGRGGMMPGGDEGGGGGDAVPPSRWEYAYEAKPEQQLGFAALLTRRGRDGWEYAGVVSFAEPAAPRPGAGMGGPGAGGMAGMSDASARTVSVVVFKRPTAPPVASVPAFSPPVGGVARFDPATMTDEQIRMMMARYDTDGDGRLSAAEAAGNERLRDVFAQYDANRDGFLDVAEYRAYIVARLRERQPPAAVAGFKTVTLKHATAADLARTVRELFADRRVPGTERPSLVVSSDDRRNLLLFSTAGNAALEAEVTKVVSELDVPTNK